MAGRVNLVILESIRYVIMLVPWYTYRALKVELILHND